MQRNVQLPVTRALIPPPVSAMATPKPEGRAMQAPVAKDLGLPRELISLLCKSSVSRNEGKGAPPEKEKIKKRRRKRDE